MAGTATRGSQARAIAQGRVIPQAGESAFPLLAVLLRRRVMPPLPRRVMPPQRRPGDRGELTVGAGTFLPEQIADRLLVAWVGAPIRRGWTVRERPSRGGSRRIWLEQLSGMPSAWRS